MKEVTWDGLDFAALQMLMVDHRWNGQPGVQMDKNRHVTVLTTDPAASSAMFATITAGYTVQIGGRRPGGHPGASRAVRPGQARVRMPGEGISG